MSPLGTLLQNRRAGHTHLAWNLPNLRGPELLTVTSEDFTDGNPIPLTHAGGRIGGGNLSPHLTWSTPPPGTRQLLLIIEDIDVPLRKPAVHCVALIDPPPTGFTPGHLPPGALSAQHPAAGVRLLRSTIGRGYHGPEPIKGHGPHRYVFQLFALPDTLTDPRRPLDRSRPRAVLTSITAPVLARGQLTGLFER